TGPFAINLDHPVLLPAPLPRHGHRLLGRLARALPLRVGVKGRFALRRQCPLRYCLGPPSAPGRNPQRTPSTPGLANLAFLAHPPPPPRGCAWRGPPPPSAAPGPPRPPPPPPAPPGSPFPPRPAPPPACCGMANGLAQPSRSARRRAWRSASPSIRSPLRSPALTAPASRLRATPPRGPPSAIPPRGAGPFSVSLPTPTPGSPLPGPTLPP